MELTNLFIARNLKRSKSTSKIWTARVHGRYLYYCNLIGVKPLGIITFYKQLEACGIRRSKNKHYFLGVELRDALDESTITDMEKRRGDISR